MKLVDYSDKFLNSIKLPALVIILGLIFLAKSSFADDSSMKLNANTLDYMIYVIDAGTSAPLHSAKVTLKANGLTAAYDFTNGSGKLFVRNLKPGAYNLIVSFDEYETYSKIIQIDDNHIADTVKLKLLSFVSNPVTVSAYKLDEIRTIQAKSGIQLFDSKIYHASPNTQITDLIQQNVLGVAKAPTGEVHIRGQHGEYTYYIDDVPVPLGVFGGLNEVVDSKVVDRMTILTGGFPAEYGGQMAAVMDVQTRIPSGHLHFDYSSYIGSYLVFNGTRPFSPGAIVPEGPSSKVPGDTLGGRVGPFRAINTNGESFSLSSNWKGLGYFISASRLETDRRVDTPTPVLYNDHGTDYFLYGKMDYLLSANDYITMNLNYSRTDNQVPFDLQEQGYSPDNQKSSNSFETLSFYHTFPGTENNEKSFFVGAYLRQGGLNYMPSAVSPANFQFQGDSNLYSLSEDRSFNTIGLRTKFDNRLSSGLKYTAGLNFSSTNGKEDFKSRDSIGRPGPNVTTNYSGSDFGFFGEFEYLPWDWFRLDAGARYDQHIAPDVSIQDQVSPRIKFNFFIDNENTIILYYGRMFMPTNIEGLRNIASNVSNTNQATLPERDDFYEADWMHSFVFGLTVKAAAYYKSGNPGIDDETIGSSAVKTPINIAAVRTTGLELGLSYTHPTVPITAFLNTSIIHAYGYGAVTGGFLDVSEQPATDLDHDQRLSIAGELDYHPEGWFYNLVGVYGSGLKNGDTNAAKTGLFDFNASEHVSPYVYFNFSLGHTIYFTDKITLEPSIYINNIFDNNYILKGAYHSGASWGDRRNVVLKLALHLE